MTDKAFEDIMASVDATLDADPAGKKIAATIRRETLKRALTKYGGMSFPADDGGDDLPWPDEPVELVDQRVDQKLRIPEATEPYWYLDPEQARIVEHFVLMRRALGGAMHGGLLIVGGAGYGKTLMVPHIIERMNRERNLNLSVFKMDCAVVTDPQKWFGRREISKAGSRYETSDFIRATESGMVVQLDELNRIHPHVSDSVHALLDGTGTVSLSDLNLTVTVHPETVFIATMNVGAAYGGTYRLDHAFRSRFGTTIEVGPPPKDDEIAVVARNTGCDLDAAAVLVGIAESTRSLFATGDLRHEISTRDLVAAGRWVAAGMSERDALGITAIPQFDGDASGASVGQESERARVLSIIDGKLAR